MNRNIKTIFCAVFAAVLTLGCRFTVPFDSPPYFGDHVWLSIIMRPLVMIPYIITFIVTAFPSRIGYLHGLEDPVFYGVLFAQWFGVSWVVFTLVSKRFKP